MHNRRELHPVICAGDRDVVINKKAPGKFREL